MGRPAVILATLLGVASGCRSGASSPTGAGGNGGNGGTTAAGGSTTSTAGNGGNGGSTATGGSTTSTAGNGAGGVGAAGGMGGVPVDGGADGAVVGAFAAQALAIAGEYTAWGRVDDELRWAPFLCRQPLPGIARPSESHDSTTHGQKLYSVFVKHHDAYPNGPYEDQVVVKQSWTAELVSTPDAAFSPGSYRAEPDAGDHFYPYAEGDGGVYRAAAPAGLFVMFRLDPATPDTDEGWVYATVSTSGEVTSAGRVASCMGCHESATHERLFGVPLSPAF
jgi:hypothetical protein